MKVLDLQCDQHHVFEGWFGSEDDYQSQLARGLLTCPMCGDARVTKKLSAPRLNLNTQRGDRNSTSDTTAMPADTAATHASGASTPPVPHSAQASAVAPAVPALASQLPSLQDVANLEPAQLQAALLNMVRQVVANTEDVGDSFPEEARKMHYGEAEPRNIRGHATPEETEELMDEGIAVMPLPLPDVLKEPLQ
jgi:hypothetical protein